MHIYWYKHNFHDCFHYSKQSVQHVLEGLIGKKLQGVYLDMESCGGDIYPDIDDEGQKMCVNFDTDGQVLFDIGGQWLHVKSYGRGLISLERTSIELDIDSSSDGDDAYGQRFLKEPYHFLRTLIGNVVTSVEVSMGQDVIYEMAGFMPSEGAVWPMEITFTFADQVSLGVAGQQDWMVLNVNRITDLTELAQEGASVAAIVHTMEDM